MFRHNGVAWGLGRDRALGSEHGVKADGVPAYHRWGDLSVALSCFLLRLWDIALLGALVLNLNHYFNPAATLHRHLTAGS